MESFQTCLTNNERLASKMCFNVLLKFLSSDCNDELIVKPVLHVCRSDIDFQEFCLQVLFECVSKDRPALLQVMIHHTNVFYLDNSLKRFLNDVQ